MPEAGFLEATAPFLVNYWPYVLGGALTLILAAVVAYFLTPGQEEGGEGQRENGEGRGENTREGEENREGEARAATGAGGRPTQGGEGGTPKNPEKDRKSIVSIDKGEHPLGEFDDERPDPSLAPPQHDPDLPHIPYTPEQLSTEEMKERSLSFYHNLDTRRSVRHFSTDPVPQEVIENIVLAAGTSPSGAHSEPWTFVVVKDPETKTKIREIVEQEEYLNYDRRMGERWVRDLKFIRTTHEKPYLEKAPYLIIVFKQAYHTGEDGTRHAHYYFEISTAIACGILITAIHNAGLVTVTTTPLNAGTVTEGCDIIILACLGRGLRICVCSFLYNYTHV